MKKLLLLLALLVSWGVEAQYLSGSYKVDNTFKTVKLKNYAGANIYNTATQSTGKVIVHGYFSRVSGEQNMNSVIRLNLDGTIDKTFNQILGLSDKSKILVFPNDKILAISVSVEKKYYAAAILNADGTFFKSVIQSVYYVDDQPPILSTDGKAAYVVFRTYTYQQGVIKKILIDGTVDETFISPSYPYNNLFSIGETSDKKLMVSSYEGNGVVKIDRLNTSGKIDSTFNTFRASSSFSFPFLSMAVIGKKTILSVRYLEKIGTKDAKSYDEVIRLNEDGSHDVNFNISEYTKFFSGNISVYNYQNNLLTNVSNQLIAFGSNDKVSVNTPLKLGGNTYSVFIDSRGILHAFGSFNILNNHTNFVRINNDFTIDKTFSPVLSNNNSLTTFINQEGKLSVRSLNNTSFYRQGSIFEESLVRFNKDGTSDNNFTNRNTISKSSAFKFDGSLRYIDVEQTPQGYDYTVNEYSANGSVLKNILKTNGNYSSVDIISVADSSTWIRTSSSFSRYTKSDVYDNKLSFTNSNGTNYTFPSDERMLSMLKGIDGKIRLITLGGDWISGFAVYTIFISTFSIKGVFEQKVKSGAFATEYPDIIGVYAESIELYGAYKSIEDRNLPGRQSVCIDYNGVILGNCGTKLSIKGSDATQTQIINTFTDGSLLALVKNEELIKLNPLKSQIITFDTITNKFVNTVPFLILAKASSGLPISYKVVSGPAKVAGNTITLDGIAGTVVIQAYQDGNDEYGSTSVNRTFKVEQLTTQTITFDAIPNKTALDKTVTLSAKSTSALPISFLVVSGPAKISGNTLTLDGVVGTVVVRASQAGDASYASAKTVDQSFKVELAPQTITFEPVAEKFNNAPPFQVVAKASSALPVNLSVIGPAKLDGSTVTLNGTPGVVVIKGSQGGSSQYTATEASLSINVILLLATQKEDTTLQIYPNPANNYLMARIAKPSHNLQASLIAMNGLEVTSNDAHDTNEISLNISILPAGTYLLRLTVNGEILNHKVVIFK
jgi:Secretion system C-terminal sorting domain/Domain of unknown function (DUF5122) beta-propeller